MAASMCCRRLEGLWKLNTNMRLQYIGKRTILSDAYRCDKAWKVYLQAPTLREVDAVSFQNEIYNKYQKLKNVSAVDIDILAHVLPSVPPVQLPFTVELFEMFRHCREAVEAKESYHYALIRSCIEMKNEKMLMSMLSKKLKYGVFPDNYSGNILMDHLIKQENYADAAKVSYGFMLQNELGHPSTRLMCLYSCALHLQNGAVVKVEPQEEQETVLEEESQATSELIEEEKEVEYKLRPVLYISLPYYDDHFDIRDDVLLLGKTFHALGQVLPEEQKLMSQSCKFLGLGLYQKFEKGLELGRNILESDDKNVLSKMAVEFFTQSLENAPTREEEVPDIDPGLLKMKHVKYKLRLTEKMKEERLSELKDLTQKLSNEGKIAEDDLCEVAKSYVEKELPQYEENDIKAQEDSFRKWSEDREISVDKQIKYYLRLQKQKAIHVQLKKLEIREKEMEFRLDPKHFKKLTKKQRKLERLKVKERARAVAERKKKEEAGWEL